MTKPIRVAVVRPYEKPSAGLIKAASQVGWTFLNAWILMLILASITPWHPAYWTTYLLLLGVGILRTQPVPAAPSWTWAGKKGETS